MARSAPRSTRANEVRSRKERKSFTLSGEAVAALNELRASRAGARRRSTSAVLDELLRSVAAERRKKRIEQNIASYYDSVSDAEREEESRWGEFALAQFVEAE